MATTTPNYGWPVPTSSDLVKNGATAIEALGDAADATMATMVPKSIVDAKGDLIAATAADTVSRLAVGTNGQVLTADSTAATGLAWATAAGGGGKVLQVVNATYATEVTNSTNTYADTGLTATITCSSTSSKVLVIVTQNGVGKSAGNAGNGVDIRLSLPGGSTIQFGYAVGYDGVAIERFHGTVGLAYLHSPASAAAITYKTQFKNFTNAANVVVQNDSLATSSIVLMEIGA